jgi:hypothetical protein
MVEPGDEPPAEADEALCNTPGDVQPPGCVRLPGVLSVEKIVAKKQCFVKMANKRQERIW